MGFQDPLPKNSQKINNKEKNKKSSSPEVNKILELL